MKHPKVIITDTSKSVIPTVQTTIETTSWKGPFNEALIACPDDTVWDKYLKIHTLKPLVVFAEDNRLQDAKPGEATPYCVIGHILGHIPLSTDQVHVDIGCGAGRLVNCLSLLNLKHVTGVDMHPECISHSQNNLKLNPHVRTPVTIIRQDAATDLPKGDVYWMFNPFGEKTLRSVLGRISILNPSASIIYINPVYDYILNAAGWPQIKQLKIGGYLITIYKQPDELHR